MAAECNKSTAFLTSETYRMDYHDGMCARMGVPVIMMDLGRFIRALKSVSMSLQGLDFRSPGGLLWGQKDRRTPDGEEGILSIF